MIWVTPGSNYLFHQIRINNIKPIMHSSPIMSNTKLKLSTFFLKCVFYATHFFLFLGWAPPTCSSLFFLVWRVCVNHTPQVIIYLSNLNSICFCLTILSTWSQARCNRICLFCSSTNLSVSRINHNPTPIITNNPSTNNNSILFYRDL
jgi:hypothetical protein